MKNIVNWGIIGPGRIARKFAHDLTLLPNARLHGVASKNIERAYQFAQEFSVTKTYPTYEALAADPDIDIVYIATLHTGHYNDSLLCLTHGKHVLCEKPIAMNSMQFERMVEVAKREKVFFMEALWTRFVPSFKNLLEMYNRGAIGTLRMITADFCINPPYSRSSRLFNPVMGGGALLDIGIYPVFLALEIAGMPLDITTTAILDEHNIDTICAITMKHERNIVSQLSCASRTNGRIEALLHGSTGMLQLQKCWHQPTILTMTPDGNVAEDTIFNEDGFGYQYEAQEAMNCCTQGLQESPIWSWEKSRNLINTLDTIRSQAGIVYPETIESL